LIVKLSGDHNFGCYQAIIEPYLTVPVPK
jgi:hypothetical protein